MYTSNTSILLKAEPAAFFIVIAISADVTFLSTTTAKSFFTLGNFENSLYFIFPTFLSNNLSKSISKTYTASFTRDGCTLPIRPTMSLFTEISADCPGCNSSGNCPSFITKLYLFAYPK